MYLLVGYYTCTVQTHIRRIATHNYTNRFLVVFHSWKKNCNTYQDRWNIWPYHPTQILHSVSHSNMEYRWLCYDNCFWIMQAMHQAKIWTIKLRNFAVWYSFFIHHNSLYFIATSFFVQIIALVFFYLKKF